MERVVRTDNLCDICPARYLRLGEFNVTEACRDVRYDPELDMRTDRQGVPTCIHPEKVGLPVGDYVGCTVPTLPEQTSLADSLPENKAELVDWIVGAIACTDPVMLVETLENMEKIISERFDSDTYVQTIRDALERITASTSE